MQLVMVSTNESRELQLSLRLIWTSTVMDSIISVMYKNQSLGLLVSF